MQLSVYLFEDQASKAALQPLTQHRQVAELWANIEIEGYDGKTIQVIQYAKSQGLTRKEAESNAKKIKYNYLQKGKDHQEGHSPQTLLPEGL